MLDSADRAPAVSRPDPAAPTTKTLAPPKFEHPLRRGHSNASFSAAEGNATAAADANAYDDANANDNVDAAAATAAVAESSWPEVSAAHGRPQQRRGRVERSRRQKGGSVEEICIFTAAGRPSGEGGCRSGDGGGGGGKRGDCAASTAVVERSDARRGAGGRDDGAEGARRASDEVSGPRSSSHRVLGRHSSSRSDASAALATLSAVGDRHRAAPSASRRHLHTTAATSGEKASEGPVGGIDGRRIGAVGGGGGGKSGGSIASLDAGSGEKEQPQRSRGGSFSASVDAGAASVGAGVGVDENAASGPPYDVGVGVGVTDVGRGREGARWGGGGGARGSGEQLLASSWGSSASTGRMGGAGAGAGACVGAGAGAGYRRSVRPLERSRGESLQRSLEDALEVRGCTGSVVLNTFSMYWEVGVGWVYNVLNVVSKV